MTAETPSGADGDGWRRTAADGCCYSSQPRTQTPPRRFRELGLSRETEQEPAYVRTSAANLDSSYKAVAMICTPSPLVQRPSRILSTSPEDVVVDLKGFEVGDSIHISAVTLPKGAKTAIDDRDFTIATIVAPSALRSSEGDTTKEDEGEAEAE